MGKGPSTMEMTQQTLNREALFSDQSKYYQSPFVPDPFNWVVPLEK